MNDLLPKMITGLPEIDMPVDSITGHLIQGETTQSIFFLVKAGTHLPEHSHEAQWGIVIEGTFEITLGDEKTVYTKGQTYFVPAGTLHAGYYVTDVISFDVFDTPDKFEMKSTKKTA
ncbi:cupin domain-containing protein [Oceanidesulfovibrio marinus]|uniref:Cupin domain-containing protein n=1 Tax=Oceanidesulfovibrio marinus TaxID=370038 RepID=A0ABX6NE46_9BACT|nr:cupin domain-containing protein [Oceanidesulfovibrio marinus]QJT08439.1 cupin domain-containing protein [Oceanidesulfovibrio marinus]